MRGKVTRQVFSGYAVAWLYLAAVCAAEIVDVLLPPPDQAVLLRWASTNVHNLQHDPVGSLLASAFFTQGYLLARPSPSRCCMAAGSPAPRPRWTSCC